MKDACRIEIDLEAIEVEGKHVCQITDNTEIGQYLETKYRNLGRWLLAEENEITIYGHL